MRPARTLLMAAALVVLAGTGRVALAEAANSRTDQILFVCEHGNGKSLMAASYFNQLAYERDLPFVAVARGVELTSTTASPRVAAALLRDKIDVSDFQPRAVTAADVESSRRVILIGATLPASAAVAGIPTEEWNDASMANIGIQGLAELIKQRTESLVEQLASE